MNHLVTITKADGTKQLFEEEKLVNSLRRVNASPQVIDEIVEQVGGEIHEGMPTSEIYDRAFSLLRKESLPAAVKYSIRHGLTELGPDGFPFEKLVARIFRLWGYETLTDQTLLGKCVEHEVDVVAWKGDSLAMCEAKFHNQFGMRSDVKITLYIKARFDDLAETTFSYGGKQMKLNERWLVTNTKFTDRAIKYGECNNLKMVGWNYPKENNLHDIIEGSGLHPITCLTTLSKIQKRELADKNIVVCIDLLKDPSQFQGTSIKPDDVEKILAEAQLIIETAK